MEIIGQSFYLRDGLSVAKDLIGKILVREYAGKTYRYKIVETEAYMGPEDKASHAYGGKLTPRTKTMFDKGGITYIYLIYGMYYCLNIVAEKKGIPHAVLIRALEPIDQEAIQFATQNRNIKSKKTYDLTNGPGKLCKALSIDKTLNEIAVTKKNPLYIEDATTQNNIVSAKRINISYAEEYQYKPWRFYIEANPYVSVVERK